MRKSFLEICIEQSETITSLAALCRSLIQELAQYRSVEAEEKKIEQLEGDTNGYTN